MCTGSRDLFKFRKISDDISKTVQDNDMVAMEVKRKSYVAYRMAPFSMPLNDLEGHFFTFLTHISRET